MLYKPQYQGGIVRIERTGYLLLKEWFWHHLRGGTQKSFVEGGSVPRCNPLPFYIPFFFRKATPFVYLLLEKDTPFIYLLKKT